ncbi:hypothetical protein P186_2831 [Pyrobaculum ferrireducens]|uniref:Uncharacterized protein n=1 Tax=Pyrobaculum ferrireducens TaxID=1104324 RepID=G7VFK1_9CREN|nr:hypothetical protein P186_2831 [Pyrobaculum ferrireducens]
MQSFDVFYSFVLFIICLVSLYMAMSLERFIYVYVSYNCPVGGLGLVTLTCLVMGGLP